jgi:hypothetical protein
VYAGSIPADASKTFNVKNRAMRLKVAGRTLWVARRGRR